MARNGNSDRERVLSWGSETDSFLLEDVLTIIDNDIDLDPGEKALSNFGDGSGFQFTGGRDMRSWDREVI
jgi:hypothetical protein